jgi:uncharacterized protein (DUF58 family)
MSGVPTPDQEDGPEETADEGPVRVDATDAPVRGVDRLGVGVTAATAAIAVGLATSTPTMLLLAVAGVAYSAYGYLTDVPVPEVALDRTVESTSPVPGDDVAVTLAVENVGDDVLPDLRVVDGVPDDLPVTNGSPRCCTALRPGESTTVEYTVAARRGVHEFGATSLRSRSVSGTDELVTSATVPDDLRCRTALDEMPVTDQTIQYTGRVTTEDAGSGIEFHSTRNYRPGDPMNRIDWNRLARTGELTTIEYRQERAVTVVLVVDARKSAAVAPRPDAPDAVDLNAYAAERAALSLLDAGNRVGITVTGSGGDWLEPGAGEAHERRVRETVQGAPETGDHRSSLHRTGTHDRFRHDVESDGGMRFQRLREQLPDDAQVLLVSAATDDMPRRLTETLQVHGHSVTLLAPDVTGDDTLGGRYASLQRATTLTSVRRLGARVVDWSPADPLELAVARAVGRWL